MAVENKYGDWIKEGFELVKKDLVAWALCALVAGAANICFIIGPQVFANFLKMAREAKNNGTKPEIGKLFVFDNLVQYLIYGLIAGLACSICFLLAPLFFFGLPLMAFKGMGAIDAIKAAINYGKGNYVSLLILSLVFGVVIFIGELACIVGVFVAIPTVVVAMVIAYEAHESAIDAAQASA